jgi:ubiquinone/menaquinone biosynthesis C-methylase UbiE
VSRSATPTSAVSRSTTDRSTSWSRVSSSITSRRREREQALAEIGRVLKHGGYFAVIDISRNYGPWLVRNGFTIEKRSLNLLFSIPTRAILARKL